MPAYDISAKESIDSKYAVYTEPPERGGSRYARHTGCEREIIPVGRFDALAHAAECPHEPETEQ